MPERGRCLIFARIPLNETSILSCHATRDVNPAAIRNDELVQALSASKERIED